MFLFYVHTEHQKIIGIRFKKNVFTVNNEYTRATVAGAVLVYLLLVLNSIFSPGKHVS